jgi:hypothetical protein
MHEQLAWSDRLPKFVTMPHIEATTDLPQLPSNSIADRVMPVLSELFPFIPGSTVKSVLDASILSLENGKHESELTKSTSAVGDSTNTTLKPPFLDSFGFGSVEIGEQRPQMIWPFFDASLAAEPPFNETQPSTGFSVGDNPNTSSNRPLLEYQATQPRPSSGLLFDAYPWSQQRRPEPLTTDGGSIPPSTANFNDIAESDVGVILKVI